MIEKMTKYKKKMMILNNEILKKIEKHLIIFVYFLLTNQNTALNREILKKKFNDEVSSDDVMRKDIDDVKEHDNDIVKKMTTSVIKRFKETQ